MNKILFLIVVIALFGIGLGACIKKDIPENYAVNNYSSSVAPID